MNSYCQEQQLNPIWNALTTACATISHFKEASCGSGLALIALSVHILISLMRSTAIDQITILLTLSPHWCPA